MRSVANLSTPLALVWAEYKELGEQLGRRLFWERGTVIMGQELGGAYISDFGIVMGEK